MTADLHRLYWGEGTVEDTMASFFDYLRAAKPNVPGLDQHFIAALQSLVRLEDRQANVGRAPKELLDAFRSKAAVALSPYRDDVAEYVRHIEILADEAREEDDDWFKLCKRRSAVQILIDDFPSEVSAAIDHDELSRIDAQLRDVGQELGPVSTHKVPNGLPATHWWWRTGT